MIDIVATRGFAGYFIDEPVPLRDCYCPSCRAKYEEWYGGDLRTADSGKLEEFRQRCVIDYVTLIADHCRANHPRLETLCCLMPQDEAMWSSAASIPALNGIGTDIYWVNEQREVEDMTPMVRALGRLCQQHGKSHHEWLQCWAVRRGREPRVFEQGRILLREKPDALYVWAWKGQAGTVESCDDPGTAWGYAEKILRMAKEI